MSLCVYRAVAMNCTAAGCKCAKFAVHAFRKGICRECPHNAASHNVKEELRAAEEARKEVELQQHLLEQERLAYEKTLRQCEIVTPGTDAKNAATVKQQDLCPGYMPYSGEDAKEVSAALPA